jgi:hypothetical protein
MTPSVFNTKEKYMFGDLVLKMGKKLSLRKVKTIK